MSQQQQERSAANRSGSVKRARERAAAGVPPQPPYDPSAPRKIPSPSTGRPVAKGGQNGVAMAISRPTPVPQWPLKGVLDNGAENQQYQPPTNRGPPPQRPPRPRDVPSMLDGSKIQEHTPSFQYRPQGAPAQPQNLFPPPPQHNRRDREDDFDAISPSTQSQMTSSSRVSTVSSVGTIPDFPVPMPIPPMPRKSITVGPPPTSRRGAPSSYYSQASFVSPIPEVSESSPRSPRTLPGSHSSYASSAAIPSSWGPESPMYRSDDDDYEDDRRFDTVSEGRESRGSNESDDRGLIRSASIGKRAKPSMITTRSSYTLDPSQLVIVNNPMPTNISSRGGPSPLRNALSPTEVQRSTVWPGVKSPLAGGTGLLDATPSSSDASVPTIAKAITTDLPMRTPNSNAMLGAYQAASAIPSNPARAKSPLANESRFSRLSAIRRPPRLDIDAVRNAEARGSLTSLPDLIKRATRLAAMMDRGRRPASRMGFNGSPEDGDFPSEKELEHAFSGNNDKRGSTLSGMLSAFPPPGLGTPARETPRPLSAWPITPLTDLKGSEKEPRRQRKCCGLPCWGFIVVFIILLIIIAAAVVVPVKFLVIDKSSSTSKASVSSTQASCAANSSTACQNGGTSFIDNGACACICTNGFTGSTCTVAGSTGCTTTTLTGSTSNVTLGDSIPRLITTAQTNYTIPLSENTILARFNTANLSCASENSLVTFDGSDERVGNANDQASPSSSAAAAAKVKRDDATTIAGNIALLNTPDSTFISTNIYSSASTTTAATSQSTSTPMSSASSTTAAPSQSTQSPSTTSTPSTTATASVTMTTSTINPSAVFTITQEVLDFARVTVLFVLQEETLNNAVTAQSNLQKFFNLQSFENLAAMNVSMGSGNTINLVEFKVNLGNGTLFGSKKANGTAT